MSGAALPTLTFLGATGTVTGSKTLVDWDGHRVLVDCGLFQGYRELRRRNWRSLPVPAESIDAVVLTHAHIDHSGYLPRLVRDGFTGPVYATAATAALCRLLLPDAAHLQEADAGYANRKGFSRHHPALPLFTAADAEQALARFEPVAWREPQLLGAGLHLEFLPAGHILGAAMVRLRGAERTILFTGDLGRPNDLIMPPPDPGGAPDVLVIESTYGDRRHGENDVEGQLARVVTQTAERGGTILVPAFAVGRSHALLYLLQKLKAEGRIPDLPVYLNSPMAISAMELYCRFVQEHRLDEATCGRTCDVATYVRSPEASKALNGPGPPRVIVSASGMLTGGRVVHHLKHFGPDPRNTILFIGYQAGGTRGAALLGGATSVKVHGGLVPVRARVECIDGLSAHADADELVAWMRSLDRAPVQTYVTHGEPEAAAALADRVASELGWTCRVPAYRERAPLA